MFAGFNEYNRKQERTFKYVFLYIAICHSLMTVEWMKMTDEGNEEEEEQEIEHC